MITLDKEQERILQHLISLPKNESNTVYIGNQMPTYPSNINDKELIQIFTYLEQVDFIKIKWTGVNHNDLTVAVDITLLPDGTNYFSNKKRQKKTNKREFIRLYIPIVISLLSLAKSYENEINLLIKKLIELLSK